MCGLARRRFQRVRRHPAVDERLDVRGLRQVFGERPAADNHTHRSCRGVLLHVVCQGGKSPGCFAPAQGGSRPLSSVAAGHLLGRRTIHKQPRALGLALTLANAHGVGGGLQRPVHRDDLGVPQGGWRLRMILIEDPCAWAQHLRAAQCVQLRVRWRKLPSTVLAALRRRHFVHKVWPAATTAHVAREIQKSGPNLDQINAPSAPSQQSLVQRRWCLQRAGVDDRAGPLPGVSVCRGVPTAEACGRRRAGTPFSSTFDESVL